MRYAVAAFIIFGPPVAMFGLGLAIGIIRRSITFEKRKTP